MPSVVCAEAVALLQHLVVNGSKRVLGEADRSGARGLVGHDLSVANLDARVAPAVGLRAESGGPDLNSRVECVLGAAQEPVSFGTGRVGGINSLKIFKRAVNSNRACFDEV